MFGDVCTSRVIVSQECKYINILPPVCSTSVFSALYTWLKVSGRAGDDASSDYSFTLDQQAEENQPGAGMRRVCSASSMSVATGRIFGGGA